MMEYNTTAKVMLLAVAMVAALIAPVYLYPIFAAQLLCYALFAASFNILLGHAGLLSFGHAAFFGSGAYVSGYVMKSYGIDPILALMVGGFVGLFLGAIFGFLAIRRRGIYFAMITLALAQVVYYIAHRSEFTGGENGLQSIPRNNVLGLIDISSSTSVYYFALIVFIVVIACIYRIGASTFGTAVRAIRDNENRAVSLGYDKDKYMFMAFVLSASLSGVAGALKAIIFQFVSLTDVHWMLSGEVVLMTLLGGVGSIVGAVFGAFVVVTLHEQLGSLGSWIEVIIGAVFIICVLTFRRGLIGEVIYQFKNKRARA